MLFRSIALIWRAGCIIRSAFLGELAQTYRDNPTLENLLLDPHWNSLVTEALPAWQDITASLLRERVAIPACSSALNYYLGLITDPSSANLIQGMRDFFGAHTYERTDRPRGEFFHANWQQEN